MKYGFIKVACASPRLTVADCDSNGKNIIDEAVSLAKAGVEIAVFPELSITGYSCGDLFYQSTLQSAAVSALEKIASETSDLNMLIFAGLPFVQPDGIFDVAAAIFKGEVLALIPKSNFQNGDIFTAAGAYMETRYVSIGSFYDIPFGTDILITDSKDSRISIACEIGDDLMGPVAPSTVHAASGATVIINPFAAPEAPGAGDYIHTAVKAHSGRTISAYVASGAGWYESTQESVFGGRKLIAENGVILAECGAFDEESLISDIDVDLLVQQRLRSGFGKNTEIVSNEYISVEVDFNFNSNSNGKLNRKINPEPFFTAGCDEIAELQSRGLARRLTHIGCKSAVIGLSGGLDSTLALLITCQAFDICGLSRSGITAITMPCFGTTDRTYNNACQLASECGVTLKEIKIADSVKQHFADIGQKESDHNITYENSQARERTQVLMDYANKVNGIVIGTGDLSELALGWCTYNGDHMSMYGVNSSVPKTLVRHIVDWFAEKDNSAVLKDILDTPVSPELLPPTKGNISQVTENLVGPYELHDFYLYYILRYGFGPEKIIYLAEHSELASKYDHITMVKWLRTFYCRFFTQQFKRSCMPDGAKAGILSLSPRSSWKMPSDASGAMWLKEVDKL